jgi:hypothetical protein
VCHVKFLLSFNRYVIQATTAKTGKYNIPVHYSTQIETKIIFNKETNVEIKDAIKEFKSLELSSYVKKGSVT